MANNTISIDINARDNATSVFRSVSAGLQSFSASSSTNLNRFNNTLRTYNNTMRGFNNTIVRAMESAGRAIYNFTEDAIKRYAALEKQHSKTMGAMASDYSFSPGSVGNNTDRFYRDSSLLKSQAIKLGSTGIDNRGSLYDATEISAAQTALIKAGTSPSDIINTNALSNIIKFAGGNDIDLTQAVDFAVQLGTQFKIKPSDWDGMLDKVTYAANASIIDVSDIMDSMKYAGNVASGFDQPLSDILAALVVMGNSGLIGSQAGTGVQALFTRGMSTTGISTISLPPTAHSEYQYNNFRDQIMSEDGMFLGLENFTEELVMVMESMTDEEVSWFTRKIFGLFQQKAALALGRTDSDGNIVFGEIIDNIDSLSSGTNNTMMDLQLSSLGGQLEALDNAYVGFKQNFGESMTPIVGNVVGQAIQWLNSNGQYEIDYDSLKQSIDKSRESMTQKYGESAGSLVGNTGNLAVDLFRAGSAQTGLVAGSTDGLINLLNGDIFGAISKFGDGLRKTNRDIKELPPELQGTASGFRNLIIALEALLAFNLGTKVGELITSIVRLVHGTKITTAKCNITSANSSATVAKMNATTNTMTVYANVVNIYGGRFNNRGSGGGSGSGSGGSSPIGPLAGGFGGGALGAGGGFLLNGPRAGSLGSGSPTSTPPLLGGTPGVSGGWRGAKKVVTDANGNILSRYYKIGGKYMTSGQILASASKMLGLAGVIGSNILLTGDSQQSTSIYNDLLSDGMGSGLDNQALRNYITGGFSNSTDADWAGKRFDAQTEMISYWLSEAGSADMMNRINEEMNKSGSLSEGFIGQLMTYTGSTGGTFIGDNSQMSTLLDILFGEGYSPSWLYGGSYDDKNISNFINGKLSTSDVVTSNGITSSLLDSMSHVSDSSQSTPVVNVNVDINVDKDGRISKNIITDYSPVDSWLYRNTLRFGNNMSKLE